jgi:plasmid stability protein
MASITIRLLDEGLKRRLRMRAAKHGHSMEEEAREILRAAVAASEPDDLLTVIRRRFAKLNGVELRVRERGAGRPPPDLSGPEFGE